MYREGYLAQVQIRRAVKTLHTRLTNRDQKLYKSCYVEWQMDGLSVCCSIYIETHCVQDCVQEASPLSRIIQ